MAEPIDTSNTDPEYWERILRKEGLSMARGMSIRVAGAKLSRKILYVGTSIDLERPQSEQTLEDNYGDESKS